MTEIVGVEIVTAKDEDGQEHELLRVPEGYVMCLMSREEAARYSGWTECVAMRLVVDEDDTFAVIETTNDGDWVTGPDAT